MKLKCGAAPDVDGGAPAGLEGRMLSPAVGGLRSRLIDLARNGLIDPTALRDRVIAEAHRAE